MMKKKEVVLWWAMGKESTTRQSSPLVVGYYGALCGIVSQVNGTATSVVGMEIICILSNGRRTDLMEEESS